MDTYNDISTEVINDFVKLKIVEKNADKSKWVDIRRYWNNKPTKKGILLDLNSFKYILNLKLNI